MNEITAAITKKAFERYGSRSNHVVMSYIAGGEDAIGFMLKFVEWVDGKAIMLGENRWLYDWVNSLGEEITTEQLLIKFLEDNKL